MRVQATDEEFLDEIRDSIANVESFLKEIIQNKTLERIKPLSVELRKLLNPDSQGDFVLKRAEKRFGIQFVFSDRSKTLPRTRINVGLNDYIHRMIFAIGGRPISRIKLIKLLADQRGAHTDEKSDLLHRQSKGVLLPLGNPARDKLFFEQNHYYLIEIARTVVQAVKSQLLEK